MPSLVSLDLSKAEFKKLWSGAVKGPVSRVTFSSVELADWKPLASLKDVEVIEWPSTTKMSVDIEPLRHLPKLSVLQLPVCRGDTDFSPLRDTPQLRSLSVFFAFEDAVNWESIGSLKQLHYLEVHDAQKPFSAEALENLKELVGLNLYGCQGLTDITALTKIPGLKYLDVMGCEDINDFSPLGRMKTLHGINVGGTRVSDVSFLRRLPHLRWISVEMCHDISDRTPLQSFVQAGGTVVDE